MSVRTETEEKEKERKREVVFTSTYFNQNTMFVIWRKRLFIILVNITIYGIGTV